MPMPFIKITIFVNIENKINDLNRNRKAHLKLSKKLIPTIVHYIETFGFNHQTIMNMYCIRIEHFL